MSGVDESIILHRLMGDFEPIEETYMFLINKKLDQKELAYKPYPFQLANTSVSYTHLTLPTTPYV